MNAYTHTHTHSKHTNTADIHTKKRTYKFTTPFKADIRYLAGLQQQISQKMMLLCSTSPNVTVFRDKEGSQNSKSTCPL